MMCGEDSIVFYHFPAAEDYFSAAAADAPHTSLHLDDFKDKKGFLIAPFSPDEATPYLLLNVDKAERFSLKSITAKKFPQLQKAEFQTYRKAYGEAFARIMTALDKGLCRKIVLSHSVEMQSHDKMPELRDLFEQACLRYPERFVALWHTPQSGTWLTATPELLLQGKGRNWKTMALAGTKSEGCEKAWSRKELDEHRYVVEHIHKRLAPLSTDCHSQSAKDVCAGNVLHLLTDFSFETKPGIRATGVLSALHPTPAVCGTPCKTAKKTILESENSPREYYAGFSGIISPDETNRLFVTLRCAKFSEYGVRLFGGGGCLSGSDETLEWEESLLKMQTIKALFN